MAQSKQEEQTSTKKKYGVLKYFIYILIILVVTGISLASSLYGKFDEVVSTLSNAYISWVLIFFGVVCLSYLIEALIIKIFVRLYTRHYLLYRGMAVTMIGAFYSNVTPSASGGQVMQVYTLKKQGIQVSNAASIMVMWFILYQATLVVIGVATIIVEWQDLMVMTPLSLYNFEIPMVYVVFLGFGLNVFLILLLFLMSYSHKFHNFILHYVIGFLGFIHVLRDPDKTRENLRVQVENFKIELRRLQSNIPVVVVIILLFTILIFMRDGMPYLAILSIIGPQAGYSFNIQDYITAAWLGSFQQMCAGIIPLPGQSGISEYFFYQIYQDFVANIMGHPGGNVVEVTVNAAQILWRTLTYHLVTLVSGFVSAFYRARPRGGEVALANRQTFVDLQLSTFEERKKTSDNLYETRQLSRKGIRNALKAASAKETGVTQEEMVKEAESLPPVEEKENVETLDFVPPSTEKLTRKRAKTKTENKPGKKSPKKAKTKKEKTEHEESWDELSIDS